MNHVRISPSILSADFGKLAEEIAMLESGGADMIHIDVMDGRFVPNLTFGAKVIDVVRKQTRLMIDVHLMVVEPERYFDDFAAAGASVMTIHQEVTPHLNRQLVRIRELGCLAGVALNPSTPLHTVEDVLNDIDLLLVMSVNPGFSAQTFIARSIERIARARRMLDAANCGAMLQVDGGINRETIVNCWSAGADTFVAGSAVFGAKDPTVEIRALRAQCSERV